MVRSRAVQATNRELRALRAAFARHARSQGSAGSAVQSMRPRIQEVCHEKDPDCHRGRSGVDARYRGRPAASRGAHWRGGGVAGGIIGGLAAGALIGAAAANGRVLRPRPLLLRPRPLSITARAATGPASGSGPAMAGVGAACGSATDGRPETLRIRRGKARLCLGCRAFLVGAGTGAKFKTNWACLLDL